MILLVPGAAVRRNPREHSTRHGVTSLFAGGAMPLWVVVLPVHLASSACAEDFTGPVVGGSGGDSIRVRHEDRVEEL